jgi:hypothetical protein
VRRERSIFAQARGRRAAHEVAHPLVVEGREAVARGGHAPFTELFAAGGPGQPVGDAPGRVELAKLVEHLRGAQEVVADEARELGADAVLVARDDGRVRNLQAQRMAEQRHHREPVGNGADHGRLGKRGHIPQERPGRVPRLQHAGRRVQQRGAAQQAERDALHAPQRAAVLRVSQWWAKWRAAP